MPEDDGHSAADEVFRWELLQIWDLEDLRDLGSSLFSCSVLAAILSRKLLSKAIAFKSIFKAVSYYVPDFCNALNQSSTVSDVQSMFVITNTEYFPLTETINCLSRTVISC